MSANITSFMFASCYSYVLFLVIREESRECASRKTITCPHESPRIVVRIEQYLSENPLKKGQFSHYRPARYFAENAKKLEEKISDEVKQHFTEAFDALNALLK